MILGDKEELQKKSKKNVFLFCGEKFMVFVRKIKSSGFIYRNRLDLKFFSRLNEVRR